MAIRLVGRKAGMTRIFNEDGVSIPVTVIEVQPNRVTQIKTTETDGYRAIQVTVGTRRSSRINKATAGHFAKAKVEAGRGLWEFRLSGDDREIGIGDELTIADIGPASMVDVIGKSKGKGFQGVIKRHNFRTQDATHGNSLSHRAPGSIGQCQTPGRVWKGKKMAGHMGASRVTIQSLRVVRVCVERDIILVKGAVPGASNSDVILRPSVKAL